MGEGRIKGRREEARKRGRYSEEVRRKRESGKREGNY